MAIDRKSPPETGYNWVIMPQFYLLTAKILCERLLSSKDPMSGLLKINSFSGHEICSSNAFPPHTNYHLIFPIIFNLKHGVELFLKALSNLNDERYLADHDFKNLFDYLINENDDADIKKLLKNLKDDIWPILEKYYFGTYIHGNVQGFADTSNQAERYPHKEKCYLIPDNYDWVTEGLVKEILDDIDFLELKLRNCWIEISKKIDL